MGSKGAGITPKDLTDARNAALGFLQAVTKGDEAAAAALLIIQEGEKMDFKTMGESIEKFELGEAKADGPQVVVVAAIKGKPGQEGPPALPLDLSGEGRMESRYGREHHADDGYESRRHAQAAHRGNGQCPGPGHGRNGGRAVPRVVRCVRGGRCGR